MSETKVAQLATIDPNGKVIMAGSVVDIGSRFEVLEVVTEVQDLGEGRGVRVYYVGSNNKRRWLPPYRMYVKACSGCGGEASGSFLCPCDSFHPACAVSETHGDCSKPWPCA